MTRPEKAVTPIQGLETEPAYQFAAKRESGTIFGRGRYGGDSGRINREAGFAAGYGAPIRPAAEDSGFADTKNARVTVGLWLLVGAVLVLSAACSGLKQSYPDRKFYALSVQRASLEPGTGRGPALKISRMRVSPRYEAPGFVYRDAESSYQADYYHQFLISPGAMLTEEVRRWLTASGIFGTVMEGPSQLLPDYVLESEVTGLYGDYRSGRPPRAVLEMRFFLLRADRATPRVVLQKEYLQDIPLTGDGPQNLVSGWNEALARILAAFERDVRLTHPGRD